MTKYIKNGKKLGVLGGLGPLLLQNFCVSWQRSVRLLLIKNIL